MQFELSVQDEVFRSEVSAFLDREITVATVDEINCHIGAGPLTKALQKKLGARGWLTITWPREYGGMEGTHMQRLIVYDELSYRDAYVPHTGAQMAGPTILQFGSDELKQEYLCRISAGDIDFTLGYTEPQAGSDLASLEMRAVDDGDDFIVNGQKIFNSAAHFTDYHWLGVRTNPNVPKHKGISLLIVDLKSPGITITPLTTLCGFRSNVVFYQDVRVPKRNLVGQRDQGFYYIAKALEFERMFPMGEVRRDLDDLIAYVRDSSSGDGALRDDPLVRQRIGELAIRLEAARLLSYNVAWLMDQKIVPNYQFSMMKLYITELQQELDKLAGDILGPSWQLNKPCKWAALDGRLTYRYLYNFILTVAGGANEIQRNIIATRGLGLPR